jgi:hypothetical protein
VTQPSVSNRPALPALSYRVGTHASFKRRMIARLPRVLLAKGPSLAGLTTRSPRDFSIALIDAWAVAADVLSFYQERVANEGFLRTATERRSVLELARTIGYELRPGVAASADLVFTVEDAPDPPPGEATQHGEADARAILIPAGMRVDSMPGQDQLPEPFETSAETVVRADWNALRPRRTQPQIVALEERAGEQFPFLADESGGPLLTDADGQARRLERIYVEATTAGLSPGDRLLIATKSGQAVKTLQVLVREVTPEPDLDRTRIDLDVGLEPLPPAPLPEPPIKLFPIATIALSRMLLSQSTIGTNIVGQRWTEDALGVQLGIQGWHVAAMLKYIAQPEPPPPPLPVPQEGVFRFRERVGFFGNNAQDYRTRPKPDHLAEGTDTFPKAWDPDWRIWDDPRKATGAQEWDVVDVYLERTLDGVLEGSWALFNDDTTSLTYRVGRATERSVTGFNMSAKCTALKVRTPDDGDADFTTDYQVRKTIAHVGSEQLTLVELPIEAPVEVGTKRIELDRMVLGLERGRRLALSGVRSDLPGVVGNEIATLEQVVHQGGRTTLHLEDGLEFAYERDSLTISANAAVATHGQTVVEVLGSGDGSLAYQRFALKKPPLTYVSAPTPTGARSTLQVRVGGVLWEEARALYGLDARAERYIVRRDDDGKAVVIGGDGRTGARLPTGAENVTAVYRSGIGVGGLVAADALTLMPKRPLGVRSVTNPLPASGAADPESRDDARTNSPLTVLTLERIVSVSDYEAFARAFAGIGKAQAVAFWSGEHQLAHVTVAAANGDEVAPDSALYASLAAAIGAAQDPGQQFELHSYDRRYFDLVAGLQLDPRRLAADVLGAARAALLAQFGWERREFGQPVTAAEVIAALMQVVGVEAVALDHLQAVVDSGAREGNVEQLLPAARASLVPPRQAELLLLNPAGIELRQVSSA